MIHFIETKIDNMQHIKMIYRQNVMLQHCVVCPLSVCIGNPSCPLVFYVPCWMQRQPLCMQWVHLLGLLVEVVGGGRACLVRRQGCYGHIHLSLQQKGSCLRCQRLRRHSATHIDWRPLSTCGLFRWRPLHSWVISSCTL